MVDRIKKYGSTPLKKAFIPKAPGVLPEPEAGLNIAKYQLDLENLPEDQVLFGNITVAGLRKVLESARNFICVTKFDFGEDYLGE